MNFNERTKLAIDVVKLAGAKVLEIQKGDMGTKEKGFNDVVTLADLASEEIITSAIYKAFADDGMIAEESARWESKTGYTWVCDPLDGTKNYSRGLPIYAVSLGYMENNVPMGGAIYLPKMDELFVCERGKGAWLNGEKISVSDGDLSGGLATIGFAPTASELWKWFSSVCENVVRGSGAGILRLGAGVVGLCYLACGRTDMFSVLDCNLWDMMPASLMIEEAGGRITQLDGSEIDYTQVEKQCLLATNGVFHDKAIELVRRD